MKRLHAQCERLDLTPSHRWSVEKLHLYATRPEAANGAAPHQRDLAGLPEGSVRVVRIGPVFAECLQHDVLVLFVLPREVT